MSHPVDPPAPSHPGIHLCPYLAQPIHGPATCRLAEHGLYALLTENAALRALLGRARALLLDGGAVARDIDAALNPKTTNQ